MAYCRNAVVGKNKAPYIFNNKHKQVLVLTLQESSSAIFFHPDYTVGTGISPIQSPCHLLEGDAASRGL